MDPAHCCCISLLTVILNLLYQTLSQYFLSISGNCRLQASRQGLPCRLWFYLPNHGLVKRVDRRRHKSGTAAATSSARTALTAAASCCIAPVAAGACCFVCLVYLASYCLQILGIVFPRYIRAVCKMSTCSQHMQEAKKKKRRAVRRHEVEGAARVLAGPIKALSRLCQGSIKARLRDLRRREMLDMCLRCLLRLL